MTDAKTLEGLIERLEHAPSREFMVTQACLNVWPADRWRTWHDFLSMKGPVTYMAVNLRFHVVAEFNKLAARYAKAEA